MTAENPSSDRYEFGANWASFIDNHYSAERRRAAAHKLLSFLGKDSLEGMDFLDIGSGSGLHSLAAFDAKAGRIHSFDFDPLSVRTTARLRQLAGEPSNWTVEHGDVLDFDYLDKLGTWSLVYSWGVLHHTGAMWQAIENAAGRVAPGGLLFIALYSSNVVKPSAQFWLDVKRRYNAANASQRRRMEYWYIWRFGLGQNPLRLPQLLRQIYEKKKGRGMSYMTDVRDWLGGWPMEFADDRAVVDYLKNRFDLVRISTGEACTEFLFRCTSEVKARRS
ncbi:MAG: class I SAM-dependent methyltransferase [Mesorhizobium sp.]|uniref:class I SAM-dependent methyltransferase n=1 Tax=Mesorhizobium sp. TaxID=1871066 RepID=UPI000FE4C514|nr:class I SAM-dependent methyltransferase [Mesorhizobium sp.]RWF42409.1 MAG: class I SAM-dependent methyltransferase [Mesorhizobium sp.]TIX18792.1 MAG: class I SAM-dependent methyltransferase [Mesorhizobium sp.]TJW08626.1 MAG: class I SAM-dependent methyltransferase [Mesorhizobium sp.]